MMITLCLMITADLVTLRIWLGELYVARWWIDLID